MKTYHLVIETLLISLTLVFIINAFYGDADGDGGFMLGFWWAILGVLQVTHALAMGIIYRKHPAILRYITFYGFGIVINFLLLWFGVIGVFDIFHFTDNQLLDGIYLVTLVIIPALLALFLWYITFRFRRREIPEEKR